MSKTLDISEVKAAKDNISDLKVYGDGDTFRLLCKASSETQGWMKSTKVCNVDGGCIVQVTTQQRNPDGSYAVAEALTFVPGNIIAIEANPRVIVPIKQNEPKEVTQEMLDEEIYTLVNPIGYMNVGCKVKLPEWKGYWFKKNGQIWVHTEDGREFAETDITWVNANIWRKDWEVVE